MPSPVKLGCNAWDLNRAAEKHLGFKNVWLNDSDDVQNLVLNLLELVAEGYVRRRPRKRMSQCSALRSPLFGQGRMAGFGWGTRSFGGWCGSFRTSFFFTKTTTHVALQQLRERFESVVNNLLPRASFAVSDI
jgi:hypothetical protein